jgi:hypothetical protein
VYQKAIEYLESASPNKVYASNPIIIALSSQLKSDLDIDTFAILGLKEVSAERFIQDNIDRGVDYFVLDYWARRIFVGEIYESLEQAIVNHARLVQRIGNDPINYINIYQLVPEGEAILNGDFSKWAKGEYYMQCICLSIEEDGAPDGVRTSTFCRIYQSIPFPENRLVIDIMPNFNFATEDNETKVPKSGIVFIADGRTLTVGFSDAIDTEQFILNEDGNSVIVIRPADMGQWTQESIDLSSYWIRADWGLPDEVDVSFFVSAYHTSPGTYSLYIASVTEE